MKKFFHWIKRQYYKLWDYNGSVGEHKIYGKFRVKYPDGNVSQPFSWRAANDYKAIFGGEVIDNF